jgi:hypothetical protein
MMLSNKLKINKSLFAALLFYALPFVLFIIFLIDSSTISISDIFPLGIFLVVLPPCFIIGFVFSTIGYIKSKNEKDKRNTTIGLIGIGVGIVGLVIGAFGYMLLYVITAN